ncbi:Fur family transcriptional regulator [Chloroflexota bacterium]
MATDDLVMFGEQRLRAAGKRVTQQRKLVLGILGQASRHLDANEIYERGRRHDRSLSLSTVYRTLGMLKETRVVRELHLDGEHHHYELDERDDHSHLVCRECGRVLEVDSSPFAKAAAAVGHAHGFEVTSAEVELSGYCAACRENGRRHQL